MFQDQILVLILVTEQLRIIPPGQIWIFCPEIYRPETNRISLLHVLRKLDSGDFLFFTNGVIYSNQTAWLQLFDVCIYFW
ncbi:hypothetical protein D3C85_1263930 [compost metagenome]